jgi:hypothetical protein
MRRYLVVANQTLGGEQLTAKLAECMDAGPSRFYLVVPVTSTEGSDRWFTGGLEGVLPGADKIARTLAGGRLQHELDRLRRRVPRPTARWSSRCRWTPSASSPAGRRPTR